MRNYQREYHRTDKMKEYMKKYQAVPANKERAKRLRQKRKNE